MLILLPTVWFGLAMTVVVGCVVAMAMMPAIFWIVWMPTLSISSYFAGRMLFPFIGLFLSGVLHLSFTIVHVLSLSSLLIPFGATLLACLAFGLDWAMGSQHLGWALLKGFAVFVIIGFQATRGRDGAFEGFMERVEKEMDRYDEREE